MTEGEKNKEIQYSTFLQINESVDLFPKIDKTQV